jgi:transcriptional regulator with XRE-family HTH domain
MRSVEVELAAVGRRIADLRAAEGWRLADLAEATGYTTSYLSQIERGISIHSLTALATVASGLGVEMMALLQDTPGPTVTVTRRRGRRDPVDQRGRVPRGQPHGW